MLIPFPFLMTHVLVIVAIWNEINILTYTSLFHINFKLL